MNREEALSIVRDCLKPGRFRHSVGVAETAEKLALLWGADPEKAFLAGILHDYAKDMQSLYGSYSRSYDGSDSCRS